VHNYGKAVSVGTDGQVLWNYSFAERAEVVAMPAFIAPDKMFFSAPNRGGGALVRINDNKGVLEAEELWKVPRMRNHWSNSLVYDGAIYGFDNASLKCLSLASGEQLWSQRGFGKGSLVLAGDKMIVLSDNGELILAKTSHEGFQPLGRVKAMDGRSWTAPTISGDQVIVRNHTEMVSYRIGKKGGEK
jgi:outer membrane protein assembly factor BamB